MNILVIGGFGFIGTRLVDLLIEEGHSIYILDRSSSLYHCSEVRQPRLFLTSASIDTIFSRISFDAVYYLASQLLPASPVQADNITSTIAEDLILTLQIAYTARDRGVSKFIFASSGGSVYEDSLVQIPYCEGDALGASNAYGANKLALEFHLQVINQATFRTLSARMSNPYYFVQPKHKGQGIIPAFVHNHIIGKPLTVYGDGLNVRDYIYLDDACRALVALLSYTGAFSIFNIGSGQPHTILDVVRYIEDASKKPALLTFLPARKTDKRYAVINCTRATQELRWTPSTHLSAGIELCYHKATTYLGLGGS